jgi:hypothetical protein
MAPVCTHVQTGGLSNNETAVGTKMVRAFLHEPAAPMFPVFKMADEQCIEHVYQGVSRSMVQSKERCDATYD